MWEDYGQPKIALKVDSEEQLVQLHSEARNAGLNAHVVLDAGRTQIAPGSKTVLAIGPGEHVCTSWLCVTYLYTVNTR